MINDNIRKYRKEKGLSQEEMAVKLHVVRQTVSKWENGLSVPDAGVLIQMAELLNVPVNKLLGIEDQESNVNQLTQELARLNALLAEKNRNNARIKQANQKRGLILFLSFLSMLIALGVESPIVSLALSGGCILFAVVILYRNLALMTSVTTEDIRLGMLRVTTIVNLVVLIIGITTAILTAAGIIRFSEHGEKMFAMLLIACIMIFVGIVSPKLPFTRHTGLRLPWIVQDEDTWKVAHRILGQISLPLALLYVACSLTIPYFEQVTLVTILLWIGIPGSISYIYFWKTHLKSHKMQQ